MKADRLHEWHLVNPGNEQVHDSRSMCPLVAPDRGVCIAFLCETPYEMVASLGTRAEWQRIVHEVPGSDLAFRLLPKWEWTPDCPRPPIGTIMKARLWSSDDYTTLRVLLSRALICPNTDGTPFAIVVRDPETRL